MVSVLLRVDSGQHVSTLEKQTGIPARKLSDVLLGMWPEAKHSLTN